MPTVTKVAQSTEYVDVPIMAEANDGSTADVTGDSVFMAFVTPGGTVDDDTDFYLAGWEIIEGMQTARCLVGPNEPFVPAAGAQYDVYVKIIDLPEEPIIAAYRLYFK